MSPVLFDQEPRRASSTMYLIVQEFSNTDLQVNQWYLKDRSVAL